MDKQTARDLKGGTPVTHRTLGAGTWGYASAIDGPTAAWIVRAGETRLTLVDFTDVDATPLTAVQTWDWKESVGLEELARDLEKVSGGTIFLYPTDTGRDDNGYVISNAPLTPEQVRAAEEAAVEGEDGDPV
jgi:hypothetical protein